MKALYFLIILLIQLSYSLEGLQIDLTHLDQSTQSFQVGDTLEVKVKIPHPWHLTSNEPLDEFLIPLESHLSIQGLELSDPIFSSSHVKVFESLDLKAAWFEDSLWVKYPIQAVDTNLIGESLSYQYRLHYQACDDKICLSPTDTVIQIGTQASLTPSGPVGLATSIPSNNSSSAVTQSFMWMLFMAFLGGLILNLMPCVLPVLGLKVFSLMRQSGESKSKLIKLGFAYTLGVVASFWGLGLAVILAQKAGAAAGWGFQFTHPGFVLFMVVLVYLFALNLLGSFEITLSASALTAMDSKSHGEGLTKAFLNGAFMTLIATPCSAPFLGTSVGYALSQPASQLILFFTIAGLGLAAPFMLISLFPQFANKLPRPGDWMVRLKEFMGFTLLATMIWLMFVLSRQIGISASYWVICWLLLVALLAWIWKHWGQGYEVSISRKWTLLLAILLVSISSLVFLVYPVLETDASVEEFSMQEVETRLQEGKWVFVDYTADWCISCKVNEANVLSKDAIQAYFKNEELDFLVADYTRGNPEIAEQLSLHQRAGVPMYILYGPQGEIHLFPELLTQGLVKKVLEKYGFQPQL